MRSMTVARMRGAFDTAVTASTGTMTATDVLQPGHPGGRHARFGFGR
jgi:hypothetical protein